MATEAKHTQTQASKSVENNWHLFCMFVFDDPPYGTCKTSFWDITCELSGMSKLGVRTSLNWKISLLQTKFNVYRDHIIIMTFWRIILGEQWYLLPALCFEIGHSNSSFTMTHFIRKPTNFDTLLWISILQNENIIMAILM